MNKITARIFGFTLIELLVVLGIVALMLTLAVPRLFPAIDATKEAILQENLRSTRLTIEQFYSDTGKYPETLEQLVEKKYLKALPIDPLTESATTWIIVPAEDESMGTMADIRSGAIGKDRNGKPFSEW
jgi:general secretion pathway protein G